MIKRYADPDIEKIWADENKVATWQKVELAVMQARVSLGVMQKSDFDEISFVLSANPTDIPWWKTREKEINHDLQAWVEERVRHLPVELRVHFHDGMTSFDTEEPAFALILHKSVSFVFALTDKLLEVLNGLAIKYRHTPMTGMTHGQAAEVQTFGKRGLTWWRDILFDRETLLKAAENLIYSKLSGAIGNYGGVTPEVEQAALKILGLLPYYGATQIMPREVYAPLAQALCQLTLTIDKIATAIRLGARTPRPIYQEPFGKKQTGSSRMPGKKNTISTEQLEGMGRMAIGYLNMIMLNIKTWEERAIEQSSVERVAWPDLFHVTMRSLSVITKVLDGLQVYPDNMMREIIDTRGAWAAGPAKEFLRGKLVEYGITTEDAYRMVQLAAFIANEPSFEAKVLQKNSFVSLCKAQESLFRMEREPHRAASSIQQIITHAELWQIPSLDISEEQIAEWNRVLKIFFVEEANVGAWNEIFSLENRLKDEAHLFERLLGV